MRIVLKELEKVIAYIRKNSPDEYIIVTITDYGKELDLVVADMEAKNMTIKMYDDETGKTADIIKSSKL